MAKAKAFVGNPSNNDYYQSSVNTNYQRDQVTGELFKTSGLNVRTIIPEQITCDYLVNKYTSTDGSTFYTIPSGYVFLLTYIQHSFSISTSVIGNFSSYVQVTGYGRISTLYLAGDGTGLKNQSANSVICPNSIIVFDEGKAFNFQCPSGVGSVVLQGYLIKKSNISFSIPQLSS